MQLYILQLSTEGPSNVSTQWSTLVIFIATKYIMRGHMNIIHMNYGGLFKNAVKSNDA